MRLTDQNSRLNDPTPTTYNPLLCRLAGNRCLYAPLAPPSFLLYVPLNGNKFTERVLVINVIGLSKFLEYFFFSAGITYLEQKHFFSSGPCMMWCYICINLCTEYQQRQFTIFLCRHCRHSSRAATINVLVVILSHFSKLREFIKFSH